MNIIRQGVPFALSVLALGAAQWASAAPSTGAYVTDARNTWVQDRVGDRISTVNMIMCIIGSMRGDAMVNQPAYVALIDQGKCEGRGDSSKSGSTNAGASNATNYMSSVVQATQASDTSPLIIKAWLHDEQDNGGSPEKMTIYVYVVATAGKSEENPNGLFSMYFCGTPEGGGTCMFSGALKSDSSGLSFYQAEGSDLTRLKLQSNPTSDAGQGRVSGVDHSGSYAYNFAYDSSQFRRDDGTTDACFARDTAAGDYSTWRYGTYLSSGERLELDNPGFPVKYEYSGATYYGLWSFWGLWLPESAMDNIQLGHGTLTRRVGSSDVPLTIEKHNGKLWKLERNTSSLDEFKNVPMMFWTPNTMGSLQAGHNYELKWDGSTLQAVGEQVCSGGQCAPQALSPAVTLNAATLSASNVKALPIFFPSGGGNGTISVPGSGAFAGSNAVYYRTRTVVSPSDPTVQLDCVNQCLKSGSDLVSALTATPTQGNPYTGTWGPTTTLASYTFTAGDLTHDNNANAAVDASGVDKGDMRSYQWGLSSGNMVDHADINSVKCDSDGTPNTSGTHYCPGLVDQAAVIYQWETGPNQWNQYFGAAGVTIDPPKSLSLGAHYVNGNPGSLNNIRGSAAADYHGNTVQLQFGGFGELQGVPGGCVNPDDNSAVSCDQNTRWVPAFDILDGTSVTDGSTSYFVRYLERELRLGSLTCTGGSPSLSSAAALTLPDSTTVDVNARTTLGTEPTPASAKPAVIDGLVQSGS